jgi:hypothetical protein
MTVPVALPSVDDVRLYAVVLEAHDVAGNVRYARRLVLVYNMSSVEITPHSTIHPENANPA